MAKTPAYRLQIVFQMRERKKQEAEEIYAQKKRKLVEEQKTLDDMKQKLVDMVKMREQRKAEYVENTRRGQYTIAQMQANDRHVESLKHKEAAYQIEIDRQAERVKDAEKIAADALDAVVRATQDFKALEKHKEKWLKQIRHEQMLKEELAAEDIVQAQYFQKLLREFEE